MKSYIALSYNYFVATHVAYYQPWYCPHKTATTNLNLCAELQLQTSTKSPELLQHSYSPAGNPNTNSAYNGDEISGCTIVKAQQSPKGFPGNSIHTDRWSATKCICSWVSAPWQTRNPHVHTISFILRFGNCIICQIHQTACKSEVRRNPFCMGWSLKPTRLALGRSTSQFK